MLEKNSSGIANEGHSCPTCGNFFTTVSHLRRHETSHVRARQHQCRFCKRGFIRHDTLRRHYHSCIHKPVNIEIPVAKRGRKLQACNSCRLRKVQCDGLQPCKRCSSSQITCLYSFLDQSQTRFVPECASGEPQNLPVAHSGPSVRGSPMSFLRNFTDPSYAYITDALVTSGTLETNNAHPESLITIHGGFEQILSEDIENLFSDILPGFSMNENMRSDGPLLDTPLPASTPALQTRIHQLVSQLSTFYHPDSNLSDFSASRSQIVSAQAVFTVENLYNYVEAYFEYVHPYFPFIHRPSFDVLSVSLPLLFAVFMAGSVHCVPQDGALTARSFLDPGEEYIFGLLQQLVVGDSSTSEYQVQVVQAALLIYTLGYNSNNVCIRRRIRIYRHPMLVASARTLGLLITKRPEYYAARDWGKFIADETRIRLGSWIFLLDCMNTIFFNSPPQMTVSEMTGDLPCAMMLFEAPTADEFQRLNTKPMETKPRLSNLKGWILSLLEDDSIQHDSSNFPPFEPCHMLISIFALHSLIYTSRTNLLVRPAHRSLVRAINQWKKIWDTVYNGFEWKRLQLGFPKYSIEFWWLAQKMLELALLDDTPRWFSRGNPTDSFEELHKFVCKHAE